MSEFKFACPVCGQHITADSSASGSELACPTCFRKIRVPQAPASADPKFVLSTTEVNRPRSPQALAAERTEPPPSPAVGRPAISVGLALVLVLVCAVGATLYVLRARIFPGNAPAAEALPATEVAPAPVTNGLWSLNLSNAVYPDTIAAGRIHEREFTCERAILQGGTLTLRTGRSGPIELGFNIYFFARQPEELTGKIINVKADDPIAPRVVLRWKDGDQTVTQPFTGGYALRLDFGKPTGGRMPGKIFICLPDTGKSYVAGTFNAEIRKPPAPRPRQSGR